MTTKTDEKILFKAKPAILTIIIYIVGSVFMGGIGLMSYNTSWLGTDQKFIDVLELSGKVEAILPVIVVAFFTLYVIFVLYALLNTRIVILTSQRLIIKKPLLFSKYYILLKEISSVEEVDSTVRNRKLGNVYKGKETILRLKNGRKVKYESLSLQGYYQLNSLLRRLIANKKATKDIEDEELVNETNIDSFKRYLHENEHPENEKQMLKYIFLVIIAIGLTFGFIYSVFIA